MCSPHERPAFRVGGQRASRRNDDNTNDVFLSRKHGRRRNQLDLAFAPWRGEAVLELFTNGQVAMPTPSAEFREGYFTISSKRTPK